ncbi:MAG TPA: rhodanese-like domain-containing protein [Candidatus Acidoferrum sp.]|nr:rhodanese-like domain-containing protein [Candidatus Acidoferrum sp.]
MRDNPAQTAAPVCACQPARILREALLVAALGLAFAFLANQLSPRGLNPARNYHPGGDKLAPAPQTSNVPSGPLTATNARPSAASPDAALKARLEENGLHLLARDEVEKLFHDPRRQQDLLMFIDARDQDDYHQGHIPGAFEFYHYYPDQYLADVLTPCQLAEQIIVYCNGGDCDDSESAALFLRDRGVPAAKLFIYGGGMTNWEAARLPVESGARGSGNILNPAP